MHRTGVLVLLTAICWAVRLTPDVLAAEPAPPEPPKTLEDQLKYLEGAVAEALRGEDWKMLELTADGIAKAGISAEAREILVSHGERQAALEMMSGMSTGPEKRARVETWGLALRAMLGDKPSREQLRTMAQTAPPAPKPPEPAGAGATPSVGGLSGGSRWVLDPGAMLTAWRQQNALVCLALLKEAGVVEMALACVKQPAAATRGMTWYGGAGLDRVPSPAALAALLSDPAAGWKALTAFLADREADGFAKVAVFNTLNSAQRLLADPKAMEQRPFSLVAQLKPKLPDTARKELDDLYIVQVKACDGKDLNLVGTLAGAAYQLDLTEEAKAALTELKGRLTGQNAQHMQTVVDRAIAGRRRPSATPEAPPGQPVKPPPPPPPPPDGF